jgi:hypothetical protein
MSYSNGSTEFRRTRPNRHVGGRGFSKPHGWRCVACSCAFSECSALRSLPPSLELFGWRRVTSPRRDMLSPMLKVIFTAAAFSVLLTGEASAEPAAMLSYGTKPCGDFVAASSLDQTAYFAWAIGYVSGQNSMDVGPMRGVGRMWTPDSAMLWLKNYCNQHPLAFFAEAADMLRRDLALQDSATTD